MTDLEPRNAATWSEATCPFYVAGRHPCALGEPDGRHCGPRQYPVCVCNLDEIGRGEAWRAVLSEMQVLYCVQVAVFERLPREDFNLHVALSASKIVARCRLNAVGGLS
jgi:hypothetical protein